MVAARHCGLLIANIASLALFAVPVDGRSASDFGKRTADALPTVCSPVASMSSSGGVDADAVVMLTNSEARVQAKGSTGAGDVDEVPTEPPTMGLSRAM